MSRENLEMDMDHEKPKRQSGIRFSPFALFLLGLVIVSSVAVIIILAVFFVQQGQEISDLEKEIQVLNGSITPPPRPTDEPGTTSPLPTAPGTTLEPPPTTPLPSVWESYRLPKTVIPNHYNLHIQVHLPFDESEENNTNAFTTVGTTEIDVLCIQATDVIILHAWNLTISSGNISIVSGNKSVPVLHVSFDAVRHLMKIKLGEQLQARETYRIKIEYTGLVVTETAGLYRSFFLDSNGKRRWLAVTQFQAYKARRAFPCFDEPEFRATFDVTLKHDSRFTGTYTIRNVTEVKQTEPNWSESVFGRTGRMPTYLLAFLISDFDRNSSLTTDNVEFGVLARKDAISDATFSKMVGMNMTQHFGNIFNMSYGNYNSKLDMVAVPDFDAGAMENWGLIVYREVLMLYRQGISSAEDKKQIARVVAHELAHQWFGNPVTCSWWSESFLNEGFATYLEFPLVEQAVPAWQHDKLFTISENHVAFSTDSYEASIPLYNPTVQSPADIDNMFGRITYQKGGSVLRMMEGVMGKSAFMNALKNYLAEQSKRGITTYQELLESLTSGVQGTPINMTEKFEKWITTSGFPLVTVTREDDNTTLAVQQERFLFSSNVSANASSQLWHIPVTLIHSKSDLSVLTPENVGKPIRWLEEKNASFGNVVPEDAKWYIVNTEQYGYYRVNYDAGNWDELALQMNTNHTVIPMFNRVQLIDDSFNLARNNIVPYNVSLTLAMYLRDEREYAPWLSALQNLEYIGSMVGDKNDSLKPYMHQLLENHYTESFWNSSEVWRDDDHEDYQQLMFRSKLIDSSCYYEMDRCTSEATREFTAWKAGNGSILVNPHFKDHIFCYGVRAGTEEDFEYVLGQYRKTDVHNVKLSILRGLACSKNTTLIDKLLNLTLQTTVIRTQDTAYVFRYLARFPAAVKQSWNFMKANWGALTKRDDMISYVVGNFNTKETLAEVETFYKSLGSEIAEKLAFEGALAKIRSNIHWMDQYSANVLDLLTIKPNSPGAAENKP